MDDAMIPEWVQRIAAANRCGKCRAAVTPAMVKGAGVTVIDQGDPDDLCHGVVFLTCAGCGAEDVRMLSEEVVKEFLGQAGDVYHWLRRQHQN